MRVLLIQPDAHRGIGFRTAAMPEPLHLEMVAATVPEHELRILDMRLDAGLDAVLRQFEPEMVAVTALTPEVYAARDLLQRVKSVSPETFTVVGGHHATLLPREVFYQHFAGLYRQYDIGPYVDLVRAGKMTVEDCKRGKKMLDAMADWEQYIDGDPVLERRKSVLHLWEPDELAPSFV